MRHGHKRVALVSISKTFLLNSPIFWVFCATLTIYRNYFYIFLEYISSISHFSHISHEFSIQSSQSIRAQSTQLRSTAEALINNINSSVWNQWNDSNNALNQRSSEMCEAKNSMHLHLHKTQQEIFDIERNIDLLRRAIESKANPLKVAQTRLEARSHRAGIEQCK